MTSLKDRQRHARSRSGDLLAITGRRLACILLLVMLIGFGLVAAVAPPLVEWVGLGLATLGAAGLITQHFWQER